MQQPGPRAEDEVSGRSIRTWVRDEYRIDRMHACTVYRLSTVSKESVLETLRVMVESSHGFPPATLNGIPIPEGRIGKPRPEQCDECPHLASDGTHDARCSKATAADRRRGMAPAPRCNQTWRGPDGIDAVLFDYIDGAFRARRADALRVTVGERTLVADWTFVGGPTAAETFKEALMRVAMLESQDVPDGMSSSDFAGKVLNLAIWDGCADGWTTAEQRGRIQKVRDMAQRLREAHTAKWHVWGADRTGDPRESSR